MRLLLLSILVGIVFGKGLVLATVYVWVQDWWQPWERVLYTVSAIGNVPWVYLLDCWNLVLFKY